MLVGMLDMLQYIYLDKALSGTVEKVEADVAGEVDVGVEDLGAAGDGGDGVGVVGGQVDCEDEGAAVVEAAGGREHDVDLRQVILVGEVDVDLAVREGLQVTLLELLQHSSVQHSLLLVWFSYIAALAG